MRGHGVFTSRPYTGLTANPANRPNHVAGKTSYAEVEHRLREYHSADHSEAEHFEADIVSTRISSILQGESFVLAPPMLKQIHRHLFSGVFDDGWVGQWRQVNLTKNETVLHGDSVSYSPFHLIGEMLDYDFNQEKVRQAGYPKIGFTIDNEPFASNARYFRDALALDNTFDPDFKDSEPLNRFMEKTLFNPDITLEDLRDFAQ